MAALKHGCRYVRATPGNTTYGVSPNLAGICLKFSERKLSAQLAFGGDEMILSASKDRSLVLLPGI